MSAAITIITTVRPEKVCKKYALAANGTLQKSAVANISEGQAQCLHVPDSDTLAGLLREVTQRFDQVVCAGRWHGCDGEAFRIVTEETLAKMRGKPIGDEALSGVLTLDGQRVAARLKRGIEPSSWVLLDADNPPGIPAEWAAMTIQQRLELLEPLLPGLSSVERVELRGSSSRVHSVDEEPGPGTHAWVRVDDPTAIEHMRSFLQVAMVNHGLSFDSPRYSRIEPGKAIGKEARTVFDLSVFITGRLVFCSQPDVEPAGYRVADADVQVINRGGGLLHVAHLVLPNASELGEYRKRTGVKLELNDNGVGITCFGQLTPDTEIERRGTTRRLADWLAQMKPDEKLRCEAPFRASQSEAAFILKNADGSAIVHDVGNGTTYVLEAQGDRQGGTNLPVVRIAAGELPRMVEEAEAALVAAAGDLYRQGNRIVRPVWDVISTSAGQARVLRLSTVQPAHLLERFAEAAYFEKYVKKFGVREVARADSPTQIVDAYLARDGSWRLTSLLGVVTAPTLRSDGTILDTPGYDAASGLVFDPCGVEFLPVPEKPTKDDARRALAVLMKPIRSVPFVAPQDRAVALSGILTAAVRRALPVAPVHAYSAPTAGSGKSLVVDVASMIATGERAATTSLGRDKWGDAELEKRLVSSYLAGDLIISLDNIDVPLGGDFLCQLASQHQVKLRPLGRSVNIIVPNTSALYATGNNLVIIGDLTRRVLRGDIDAKVERPELREFDFEPVEYAKAHRAELVAAVLTIIRAWVVSGETARDKPLGGYREWSGLVRDPLVWLGEGDPVDTMEKTRKNDPRLDKLRTVIGALRATFAKREVTVREMIAACKQGLPPNEQDPERGHYYANPDLHDALLAVADNGRGEVNSEKLSWWLRKNEGRPVSLAARQATPSQRITQPDEPSYRIVKCDDHTKHDRWQVEKLEGELLVGMG